MEVVQESLRFFICACCGCHVYVCRCCDRGQIYCSKECSRMRRMSAQREASRRYQKTLPGAINHASRQRCYRANKQIVTHQGSPPIINAAELSNPEASSGSIQSLHLMSRPEAVLAVPVCRFCGCIGTGLIRRSFLKTKRRLQ